MFGPSSSIVVKMSGTQSRKTEEGVVIVLLEMLEEGIVTLVSTRVSQRDFPCYLLIQLKN